MGHSYATTDVCMDGSVREHVDGTISGRRKPIGRSASAGEHSPLVARRTRGGGGEGGGDFASSPKLRGSGASTESESESLPWQHPRNASR